MLSNVYFSTNFALTWNFCFWWWVRSSFDLWTYLMLSFVMIGQTGEGPGDIITW